MRYAALFYCLTLPLCSAFGNEQWGNLSGRFLLQGDVPATQLLRLTDSYRDNSERIPDESIIVNKRNKGVANVFVWLEDKRDSVQVHPSYASSAGDTVYLDAKRGRFVPHAITLRTSQTLVVRNKDEDASYCVKCYTYKNYMVSEIIPATQDHSSHFPIQEGRPHWVGCLIHPWMKSFILIRKNPYMTVTDDNGCFTINNLPPGHHTFRLWHEELGFLANRCIGGCCTDDKGRVKLEIKPGNNPQGRIMLRLPEAKSTTNGITNR